MVKKTSFEEDTYEETGIGGDINENEVFDLSDVDTKKAAFEPIPAGVYDAIVESCEYKKSKAGNPMIAWQFTIIEGEYQNRKLFYHTTLNDDFGKARLVLALKTICPTVSLVGFKPSEFAANGEAIGLPCRLRVKIRVGKDANGERVRQNDITDILSAEADANEFLNQ